MKLETRKIPESEPEMVEIRYHWITDEIQEIISFVKSRQGQLSAVRDGQRFEVPVVDLFYAESVDDRLFLYTAADSYEIRMKLYELEDLLKNKSFFRVSKSMIVNLMKRMVEKGLKVKILTARVAPRSNVERMPNPYIVNHLCIPSPSDMPWALAKEWTAKEFIREYNYCRQRQGGRRADAPAHE